MSLYVKLFSYKNLSIEKIKALTESKELAVFNKSVNQPVDSFENPTVYPLGDQIFFKFSYRLQDTSQTLPDHFLHLV